MVDAVRWPRSVPSSSAQDAPPTEKRSALPGTRPEAGSVRRPVAGVRKPTEPPKPTHHPNLEPASASTDDHDTLDRSDPAPIGIEAGIPSPPAKHAAHDARARRSSTDAAIKHLTTDPIDPHRNSLLPVRSAFAYFSGACEKSVASKREARGETGFELEVELESHFTRPGCPHHRVAKRV